ncbi:hypothetical protein AB0C34_01485 [Nocardia sp. NPDC049220]|uniref:hypothetical protein n=1 Tax=Nocardia sp. NPDC049220 TaxID=3155273 RepID=UPI0033C1A596
MTKSKYVNSSRQIGVVRSPLQVAWAAFDRIAAQELPTDPRPVPELELELELEPVAGASGRRVESWDGLRALLRDPALPIAAVDAIWVWLIERSRVHGGEATLVCASLAEPMLSGMAGLFAAPGSWYRHDVESEVLTGFLTHLGCVELDRPVLWHRLRWAVYRAAIRAAGQQDTKTVSFTDLAPDFDLDLDLDPIGESGRVMVAEPGHPRDSARAGRRRRGDHRRGDGVDRGVAVGAPLAGLTRRRTRALALEAAQTTPTRRSPTRGLAGRARPGRGRHQPHRSPRAQRAAPSGPPRCRRPRRAVEAPSPRAGLAQGAGCGIRP